MSQTDFNFSENPFASPQESGKSVRVLPARTSGEPSATLVEEGLLYRKVQLHSPIDATIEYVGRGLRDKILVNNTLVYWRLPVIGLSGEFEFEIETESEPVQAKVFIEIGKMLKVHLFEIRIEEQTVYRESA